NAIALFRLRAFVFAPGGRPPPFLQRSPADAPGGVFHPTPFTRLPLPAADRISFPPSASFSPPFEARPGPRKRKARHHDWCRAANPRSPGAPAMSIREPAARVYALRILPAEMPRVHTRTCLRVPFSVTMWTRRRFGSPRRRLLLFAWLTLCPNRVLFSHT